MAEPYQTSQVDFYYGNSSFLVNLRESVAGDVTLRARCSVASLPVQSTEAVTGLRHIGDSVGMSIQIPCYVTPDTDQVRDNPKGIILVHRKDAAYGYAFEANSRSFNITAADGRILGVVLAFGQDGDGDSVAVMGVPDTSGNYTVPSGGAAVLLGADSLTVSRSDGAVPAGGLVIASALITGEGNG